MTSDRAFNIIIVIVVTNSATRRANKVYIIVMQ